MCSSSRGVTALWWQLPSLHLNLIFSHLSLKTTLSLCRKSRGCLPGSLAVSRLRQAETTDFGLETFLLDSILVSLPTFKTFVIQDFLFTRLISPHKQRIQVYNHLAAFKGLATFFIKMIKRAECVIHLQHIESKEMLGAASRPQG